MKSQWNDQISSIKKLFGQQSIPIGRLSGLQQDADRFYVVTVLEAIWTGSEMIVWGGFGNGDALSTGGRYNPSTDSWIPIGQNAPEGRVYHSAIWTGFEMIVWGGLNGVTNLDLASGGRYDPSIDNWVATNL
jgi:Galactose oxidase, central domain